MALADALRRHAAVHPVAFVEESRFGMRYTIDGPLDSPDGRAPNVRVAWFIRRRGGAPILVTAFPVPRKQR